MDLEYAIRWKAHASRAIEQNKLTIEEVHDLFDGFPVNRAEDDII